MYSTFTNVIDENALGHDLNVALEELSRILVHHAGPFASEAILGSSYRQHNVIDEFTKDGIKILRYAVVDEAPMARLVVRLARNIGIAVDKRCHDGTTTSMLAFTRLALIAIRHISDEALKSKDRQTLIRDIRDGLELCRTQLAEIRITKEDLLEKALSMGIPATESTVRAAMAYHMAMVSSKGDHDLAFKISEVVRTTPDHIKDIFLNKVMGIETEEKYILTKQPYDLNVYANLVDLNDYNYKLNSQYFTENAVIFASPNQIVSSSLESKWLRSFISTKTQQRIKLQVFGTELGWESYHCGQRNLIILTPMLLDTELQADIKEFNMNNPECKISYFHTQVPHRLNTSFYNTLCFMADRPLFSNTMAFDPLNCLIGLDRPATAHLVGHTLELSNLYEKEEGEIFHPLYRDKSKNAQYTKFVEECEDLLEYSRVNVTHHALEVTEVAQLMSLYRCLTCQEIVDISVGGSAHDQNANKTVYEDAIGAALAAVKDGVVLSGYWHLANALRSDRPILEEMSWVLYNVMADSMRMDVEPTQLVPADKWTYIAADAKAYRDGEDYIFTNSLDFDGMTRFLELTPGKTILFQAWSGYDEQIKRFIDILPRLANSTHLVDMRLDDVGDNLS